MASMDELKRLSPEERIKRLKKLEEEKRKEIEEGQELMKESAIEIEKEEKIRKEIPIPQITAVNIGELFTHEERQIFATKRYEDSKLKAAPEGKKKAEPKQENTLEEEVFRLQPGLTQEQLSEQRQYGEKLAMEKPTQLYQMAREAYDEFKETGAVDQARLYALDVAVRMKDDVSPTGEYRAPSEEAQEQFGSVKSIVKYLRGR